MGLGNFFLNHRDHMLNMAAMTIYGKNFQKSSPKFVEFWFLRLICKKCLIMLFYETC